MITVNSLTVKAKEKTILDDISFSVNINSFCAVLGKNGSGKTTLLRSILSGTKNSFTSGEIFINGTDMNTLSKASLAKKVSYLPQQLPSPPVTVYELVSYGRSPYHGLNPSINEKDTRIINNALEICQCGGFSERLVPSLSGGEKQKAFLAMNIAQDTDIMLLDEPTSDMDIGAQDEFLKILKECTRKGKTVVAVLHDINGAVKFADDILILDKGKKVFFGSKKSALETNAIEKAFGIKKYSLPCGSDVFLA
ncbi:MAG: ABC transporter ATP-binding protein [Ruminococcaceae bacterium]|nr:ABC transporter ATP-binding protein [Oscillospiraceae bacterium]